MSNTTLINSVHGNVEKRGSEWEPAAWSSNFYSSAIQLCDGVSHMVSHPLLYPEFLKIPSYC